MAEARQTVRLTQESLRLTHERLVRQFHASLLTSAQIRREVSSLQGVASWVLRTTPLGWAVIRDGRVTFTNRSFDAFDRGSVIGPRWGRFLADPDGAEGDQPGRTLRDVALDEAKAMLADPAASRREGRYARAFTIVEVMVERPISTNDQTSALILVRDITALVKAETHVALMQARALEAERAAVAAELAVGVAHDLGNLVGALRARLVGLPHEPAYQLVTTAMETIIDAQAALVNRLQSVAHPRQAEAVKLHLYDDVLKPAVEMVETLLRMGNGGGRISVDIDPSRFDDIHIVAPPDEVINMIINLFLNARDAMPNGGAIRVKAARLFGGVQLIIEDQGTGVPAADLQRIFEPLFSTKGPNGMGMGLATAAALMRRLGGSISARNRPQGGACFELTFVDPVGGIPRR